ncbi:hypothetical protein QUB17_27670 [Microcoleus sp. B5-C4]
MYRNDYCQVCDRLQELAVTWGISVLTEFAVGVCVQAQALNRTQA